MLIDEAAMPVQRAVHAACEFLGLDPLYVANEGKLIAICAPEDAARLLETMRAHPLGRDAAIIGEVIDDPHHFVQMRTRFGGKRNRRLADRGSVAPHLLSTLAAGPCASCS